jgi:hypothetical protein
MLPPIPWVLGGAAVVALAGWLLALKGPAPALFAPCADGSSLHAYGGEYDGECLGDCPPGYSQLGATCIWQGQTTSGAKAWVLQTAR